MWVKSVFTDKLASAVLDIQYFQEMVKYGYFFF